MVGRFDHIELNAGTGKGQANEHPGSKIRENLRNLLIMLVEFVWVS